MSKARLRGTQISNSHQMGVEATPTRRLWRNPNNTGMFPPIHTRIIRYTSYIFRRFVCVSVCCLCVCQQVEVSNIYIYSVVVCTDLSEKVGVEEVMTARSLGDVMFSTLSQNARGLESCSRCNISSFHHLRDTACYDSDPLQVMHCLVSEPTLCKGSEWGS